MASCGTGSGSSAAGVPGTRAVQEAERAVEADVLHQLHRLREIGVGFAGKADDEIGRERQVRAARRAARRTIDLYSSAV